MDELSCSIRHLDSPLGAILRQCKAQIAYRLSIALCFRVLLEGQSSKQHLDHEDSHTPQVSPCIVPQVLYHLVRIVARGPRTTLVRVSAHAHSQTEVAQVYAKVWVNHDVLRLDVAMNYVAIMA